jgi:RimJ/RimL family protein N-acetyltransferase
MSVAQRPVGPAVPGWTVREAPPRTSMAGRFCRLEILDSERHGADLYAANQLDAAGENWTYLSVGPFDSLKAYRGWLDVVTAKDDPLFYAIIDAERNQAVGVAAYMRIDRLNGVIEVGSLNYSPLLQRRPAATEAMFLMMARVFDELGYRRYEWKCDALNAASRSAALRLGFQFEGIFRQAMVTKGRNRDTAWFSLLDTSWPLVKQAYQQWLAPANFHADGRQKTGLAALMDATLRGKSAPQGA